MEQQQWGSSAGIAALAAALAKAQGVIRGAAKDAMNPHFRAKYADLASVWDACRAALAQHGLSVIQPVSGGGQDVAITTILAHSSGEWIASTLTLRVVQPTPQAVGSAITYGRRYALAAVVGVAPDDDDGEAASGRAAGNGAHHTESAPPPPVKAAPVKKVTPAPAVEYITSAQRKALVAAVDQSAHSREDFSAWLREVVGADGTGQILTRDYARVMGRVSDSSPLMEPAPWDTPDDSTTEG